MNCPKTIKLSLKTTKKINKASHIIDCVEVNPQTFTIVMRKNQFLNSKLACEVKKVWPHT